MEWAGPGLSHTHGTGLVPEEMDGVEAVRAQAVQAAALVPALGEDVEADHASCGGGVGRAKPAEGFGWRVSLGQALPSLLHSTTLRPPACRPGAGRGTDRLGVLVTVLIQVRWWGGGGWRGAL